MKKEAFYWMASGLALLTLAGCFSVGPDYEPPKPAVPDAWHNKIQKDLDSQKTPISKRGGRSLKMICSTD